MNIMFDLVIKGANAEEFASQLQLSDVWTKSQSARLCNLNAEQAQALSLKAKSAKLDANIVEAGLSIKNFGLIALDMDSTLIQLECIDDIAAQLGVGDEVAEMTEKAMQGEFEFADFLRERSHLLKGASQEVINKTVENAQLMPGAQVLLDFAHQHGLSSYIISGGFSDIAHNVSERLNMTGFVCNELVFDNGLLTGEVTGPAGGEIIDANGKRAALEVLCMIHGQKLANAIAVGDGANDLKMLEAANIGVAYHAKPIVSQASRFHVDHNGLDTIVDFFIEAWEQAKKN